MSQMLKATNSSMNPAAAAGHPMPLQQTGPTPKGPYIQRRPDMTPHGPSTYTQNQTLVSGYPQQQMTSPPIPPNPLANVPLTNQNGALRGNPSGVGGGVTLVEGPPTESVGMEASSSQAPSQQQEGQPALANTKEKTPMCLINELARYNKILHQYTLVDEQGPAHKKTFFVKLKLGEEEYSASGPSIKKAQHAAAAIALEKTSFTHPPPKPNRSPNMGSMTEMELNALAMKRGEPAVYKPIEPRHPQFYSPPNFDYRGMYNQRYHCGRMPRTFYVSLKVGQKEFIGEGPTRQAARHNAATKALRILRNMSIPADSKGDDERESEEDNEDQLKSEISLVHEIALKRNLPVDFEVVRESGPPHMKTFVTKCLVGEFTTESEGNSKKLSKKRAAELMLEELKKLPPLPVTALRPKVKTAVNKKNRNLIKLSDSLVPTGGPVYGADRTDGMHAGQVQKADPSYGSGINPISRLIQIMQAQKKKEPVYSLVAERGLPRRREFVMQVQVEDQTCTGVGPNKKLAKRNAAEAMLQLLGYSRPSPQPAKPAIKSSTGPDVGSGDKKVTFSDISTDNGAPLGGLNKTGRQLVPGLLLIPQSGIGQNIGGPLGPLRPEQQLRELSSRHSFQVQFDDFSGQVSMNNSKEHLCRLSVGTNPQQVLHGTGPSPEASRDAASLSALKVLADMGYYVDDKKHMGDGLQIKAEINTSIPPPSLGGAATQILKKE